MGVRRTTLATSGALVVLPFLVPPMVAAAALTLSMIPAGAMAVRTYHRIPAGRQSVAVATTGWLLATVVGADLLLHDGVGGFASILACIAAAVLLFVAIVLVAHARARARTREGVIDGCAALAGMVVIQSQWLAMDPGANFVSVAGHISPLVGVFGMISVVSICYGISRDPRQDRRLLCSMWAASTLTVLGVAVTGSFSRPDNLSWGVSCFLVAGQLMFSVYRSPQYGMLFEPEPPRPRMLSMRWLGPACALATTPLMLALFIVRGAVPTAAVAVACAALTGLALWRGGRVAKDRERARRELMAEQRFRNLVEHAADVIVIVDDELCISYAAGGLEELLGSSPEQLAGTPVEALLPAESAAYLAVAVASLTREGESVELQRDICVRVRHDTARWISVRVTDHRQTAGIAGLVLNIHDVTGRKQAEQALEMVAHYDSLTGLPNRAALRLQLEQALTTSPGATALLFCDLDGFKNVNDTFGHESGDQLLQAVAGRWSAVLRPGDTLGRWGGDEFLLICRGVMSQAGTQVITDRLRRCLDHPFTLDGGPARVGASVGAVFHVQGETPAALIARADAAMYEAKRTRARR